MRAISETRVRMRERQGGKAMDEKTLERSVEQRLVRRCKEEGILCLKITEAKGWPDRELIGFGRVMFVELKRPRGGRLSPMQRYVQADIAAHGVQPITVKGAEGIEIAIDYIKTGRLRLS